MILPLTSKMVIVMGVLMEVTIHSDIHMVGEGVKTSISLLIGGISYKHTLDRPWF